VFACFCVQGLRCHIQAVLGPDNGGAFNRDFGEALRVAQWLKDTSPLTIGKADVADCAVLECKAQLVLADDLHANDRNHLAWMHVTHDRDFSGGDLSGSRAFPALRAARNALEARGKCLGCGDVSRHVAGVGHRPSGGAAIARENAEP
jgi:hypothetical protein